MGNAVSPQVAAALGRCLALAAVHASPPEEMLIAVPDPEYELVRGGGGGGMARTWGQCGQLPPQHGCTAACCCERLVPHTPTRYPHAR